MRGRTIWTQSVDVSVLDTVETNKDPDLTGPLTSGFDDVFMEPVLVQESPDTLGAPRGVSATKYKLLKKVPCQIRTENLELLQQMASGPSPGLRMWVTFHYRELERLSLLDANKNASVFRNCRLDAIYHRSGELLMKFEDARRPYAQEIRPVGFGLSGGRINLLHVRFEDRELSSRG